MKQKKMIILISILIVIIAIQFAMLMSTRKFINLMDNQIDEAFNIAIGKLEWVQEYLSAEQTAESMSSMAPDINIIHSKMSQLSNYYGNLYNSSYYKTQELWVAVSRITADIFFYATYDLPGRYSSNEPLAPIDVKKVELSRSMIKIVYTVMKSYHVPDEHFSLKSLSEIYTQICAGVEKHFAAEYGALLDYKDLLNMETIFDNIY